MPTPPPRSSLAALLLVIACGDDTSASADTEGSTSSAASTSSDTTTAATSTLDETSSESSTTGPMPCVGNEDCPDAAAPFCEPVSGECVACDGTDDPDGACAGLDPMAPLCVNGTCVACTRESPVVCDGQLLLCDGGTNTCIQCTEHDQCGSGACELAVGRCFPEDFVVHVDGDEEELQSQQISAVNAAVQAVAARAFAVIVVHELEGGVHYGPVSVDAGKTIALLAAPGEQPVFQGFGANTGIRVQGAGTALYMDGLHVAGSGGPGLRVDGAFAWVDRSRIVQNTGGGIVAQSAAELTLRNCFIGGDVSDITAFTVNGSTATVLYTTTGAGFGAAAALACDAGATVEVRNSLFVARTDSDEVMCNATIEQSAAELDLGGTNTALGPMNTNWFTGYGMGDFSMSAMHPAAIDTTARWTTGDPTTDIDGDLRPTMDGTADYAGADVP